ncbi:MAG TPA: acetate--CoA ligase family protein [Thermoanaerobaculia bacterium]|nr:acetate--CoA ligase family protein [Thermoanaerobaculia bacterium]
MRENAAPPPGRPLDPIFSPRSVAVVGASRDRDSIGFAILHNLVMAQFTGAIYPVNPTAAAIHSLKCYPSVAAIPDPVDLAVVAVPKGAVAGVVDACLEHGVRGFVVITAGFGETGEAGARAEAELRRRMRAAGARMVGPNCMGVINTRPEISLNATFAPTPALPGTLGFVSQSGALGVAILNVAADLGLGLTQFASMGNKADVSGNDLLEHWEHDPETRVIAMYLESFGNPRRFTEIARRVGRRKPILVVKSGRTMEGARAATSHTGALAGADVTVSAFLDQCGVLRANTIEELFDVARALDRCPLPAGRRVAIVTNAGGPGIMATDACVDLGLEIATLGEDTRRRLAALLPAEASVGNPVDMIASAGVAAYRDCLASVLADPAVDMAMVINVTPLLSNPDDILAAVTDGCAGQGKPVLAVMMATDDFYDRIKRERGHPPVYRFPESAARALHMLARYAAWRRRPEPGPRPDFAVDDEAVAALLTGALEQGSGEGWLAPDAALRLLELYGVPVAPWRLVRGAAAGGAPDVEAVLAAAEEIGYPVVVKAVAPDLVHKSDVGAVATDLRDRDELAAALAAVGRSVAAAGHAVDGFLLQRMVRGGREVIFGISTDPRFGPLVAFGLGGRYVEVFQDVRFGVTPLEPDEAREMVRGIRGFPLLAGVRGEQPVDLGQLEEVLLRLAQLAERHPRLVELDVNPFLAAASPGDACAVDVRARVAPPGRAAMLH